jgi:hypothetical protein
MSSKLPVITVRLDAELHRRAKLAAEVAGESLNEYCVSAIRVRVGPDFKREDEPNATGSVLDGVG